MELNCTTKFNTQLSITINSAPNNVQPLLVLQYNSQVHSKSLYISQRHNHSNVSILIVAFTKEMQKTHCYATGTVALLRRHNNLIVTQQGAEVMLPRKPNM
jgi:hypothetical protein